MLENNGRLSLYYIHSYSLNAWPSDTVFAVLPIGREGHKARQ